MRDGRATTAIPEKPTILICGTVHFAWRQDFHTIEVGDVAGAKRSEEIQDVVTRLASFHPTHVAVEVERTRDEALNTRYQMYLTGGLSLEPSEVEQIGFRLAGAQGHRSVYPVDWMGSIPGQRAYGEVMDWADSHQPAIHRELTRGGSGATSAADRPLLELLRDVNREESDRESQQRYLRFAQIGQGDDYVGLDWLAWWYRRNLTLYVNIARLAQTPEARVLVLIGAGHRFLLRQFLIESGRCAVEDALTYLT